MNRIKLAEAPEANATEEAADMVPQLVPDPALEHTDGKWGEREVLRAIGRCGKFGPPTAAFLSHVHGGVSGTRSADGVSVGIWHSRGLLIQGFEVKVSRGDWLRELKDPGKADGAVFPYCDRWWLVTPKSVRIIKPGELPEPWGHATVDARGLHVEKEAPQLSPQLLDRPFVSELFRRAVEQLPEDRLLRKARSDGYSEGSKRANENFQDHVKFLEERNTELEKMIRDFEGILGTKIHFWGDDRRAGDVRRALRFVIENGHENMIGELRRVRRIVAETLEDIDGHLGEAAPGSAESAR